MVNVVGRIAESPGIHARVEHNPPDHRIPSAVVYFTDDWRGPDRMEIQRRLLAGVPRVCVQVIRPSGELYGDPTNLAKRSVTMGCFFTIIFLFPVQPPIALRSMGYKAVR